MSGSKISTDLIKGFVILFSLISAAVLFMIGVLTGLDSRLYMYKVAVILTGVLLFHLLSRMDCLSVIRYYRVELILMVVFLIAAYVFLGEKTGGTIWLNIGRYLSVPFEAVLYLFVPVILLIIYSGRMEKSETPTFKRTRILYAILMIVYLGAFLWMSMSEHSNGIGLFGRASSLIGLYLGVAILTPSIREEDVEN